MAFFKVTYHTLKHSKRVDYDILLTKISVRPGQQLAEFLELVDFLILKFQFNCSYRRGRPG